jgi:predicted adenylyl cyclase CyaB
MDIELECKFIKQNHDLIRKKLKEHGAELIQKERLMVRANYDFPDYRLFKEHKAWVRVRDEGDVVILSYKQSDDSTLKGMQAVDLRVDSFERANDFCLALGMIKKAYQETKRESWLLGDVQVELDTWPWLSPYVELEAPNETSLKNVAKMLGFDIGKALYGSVIPAYQAEYKITAEEMSNWPEYRFDQPMPDWLKRRKI